jgi:cystathionine beta-lyase
MLYDFDELLERQATECVKWHKFAEDVLPMWVADMDFTSPEPVIQALRERVDHGVFGYPQESPELRAVIIERLSELYGWEVAPDEIILLPGVIEGFNLACQAQASGGGGVLQQPPIYPPFLRAPGNAGMELQEAELVRDEQGVYGIDWEVFEQAVDERTRVFMLCNPHNPVGRVYRREELERMAEICLSRGVVICSDEIHCDLVYSEYTHIPMATLDPEVAQNTITLMAPSKTFNLPGLQASFAVIQNADLRERFDKERRDLVPWVNVMGLVAMQAAYQDGQDWYEQLMVYLEGNRDYVYRYVQEELPGISMAKPEGTYLAWLDCRETGIPKNPCEFFIEKGRVGLNDGKTFGSGGEGFVRLNFGCPREVLSEGLARIRQALESLEGD